MWMCASHVCVPATCVCVPVMSVGAPVISHMCLGDASCVCVGVCQSQVYVGVCQCHTCVAFSSDKSRR